MCVCVCMHVEVHTVFGSYIHIFTVCVCVYYLCRKKIDNFLSYRLSKKSRFWFVHFIEK